ncbi:MAG: xylulose kinase, partial [Deltaproteobacteria bacterium]|nr:xylulose kinase [Deltaproteobacteria bacterium]
YVEKFMGRRMDPIHMVGGGAASDIWCQIHADVLDRTVKQVKDPIQTNARGAAFIASVGLGYMTFEEIPQHIKIQHTFEPNPDNRQIYDDLFDVYLKIYKKNKDIFKQLNANA